MSIDELTYRLLEDRDSLSDDELLALVEAAKADEALAARLRGQLMMDDLLAQKLTVDRRNFEAQVAQRLRDLAAGEAAMAEQVNEVRALVLDEYQYKLKHHARWRRLQNVALLASSLAVLVIMGVALNRWQLSVRGIGIVTAYEGEVSISRGGKRVPLEEQLSLRAGDVIDTRDGASLAWRYDDGTRVQLAGISRVVVGVSRESRGKRVDLKSGNLAASITPQPQGQAMVFATPQAEALVLGTEILLEALPEETRLEVTNGRVQLVRTSDGGQVRVNAEQLGLASRERLEVQPVAWPVHHGGLTFLFDATRRTAASRSAATGVLREIDLQPRGKAAMNATGEMEFSGEGTLEATAANADLLVALQASGQLTIEMEVTPTAVQGGESRVLAFGENHEREYFSLCQDNGTWVWRMPFAIDNKAAPEKNKVADLISLGTVTPGKPQHVAITFCDGTLTAWLDGQRVREEKLAPGNFAKWQPAKLTFGNTAGGDAKPWRGTIAAAAIYNQALTPEQIEKHAVRLRERK